MRTSEYITTCCKQSICENCGFTVKQCPLCTAKQGPYEQEEDDDEGAGVYQDEGDDQLVETGNLDDEKEAFRKRHD